MISGDWSSDVCSSDLERAEHEALLPERKRDQGVQSGSEVACH